MRRADALGTTGQVVNGSRETIHVPTYERVNGSPTDPGPSKRRVRLNCVCFVMSDYFHDRFFDFC